MKKLKIAALIFILIFFCRDALAVQGKLSNSPNGFSDIFIIGHKSPDLDSVVAAICYANYKNLTEKNNLYLPMVAENIDIQTDYILNKFGFSHPPILKNGIGANLILIDHNEFSQAVDGIENAKIIEVLDHHKVNFHYPEPIRFEALPRGSTCSIIAQKYFDTGVEMNSQLAALMLAAVLKDTVITKSPTCTENDKKIIEKLASRANISDWKAFGLEIFKVHSTVSKLSDEKIIKSDFKNYDFKSGKFGVGQVEAVDLTEFNGRETGLLNKLSQIKKDGKYYMVMLILTDIMKEESLFLVATDNPAEFENIFGAKLNNGQVYIPGMISRKKQIVPKLAETFDK